MDDRNIPKANEEQGSLKEKAFQIAKRLMSDQGFKIRKRTHQEGIYYPVNLRLFKYENHMEICWHESIHVAKPLGGWDLTKLKNATKGVAEAKAPLSNKFTTSPKIFTLVWPEATVIFEAEDEEQRDAFVSCFLQILAELAIYSDDPESTPAEAKSSSPIAHRETSAHVMKEFFRVHGNCLKAQECAMDEMIALKWVNGFKLIDRFLLLKRTANMYIAWKQWTKFIQWVNKEKMEEDRFQWHLHAKVSSGSDLHAWYHSVFCAEVYRLQGPFWFKPAKLSVYKCTNTPVGGAPLTPMEKTILASVMCTKGTTYVDVAVQMYTVQAVLGEEEFQLYQKLTSGEVELIKHAARVKPSKKKFRISFVSGALYLTWEDKNGYKGIGLHEVLTIVSGTKTDDDSDLYLSLLLPDRSLDISFESLEQRHMWQGFLNTLVLKERGDAFDIRKDFKYS